MSARLRLAARFAEAAAQTAIASVKASDDGVPDGALLARAKEFEDAARRALAAVPDDERWKEGWRVKCFLDLVRIASGELPC